MDRLFELADRVYVKADCGCPIVASQLKDFSIDGLDNLDIMMVALQRTTGDARSRV